MNNQVGFSAGGIVGATVGLLFACGIIGAPLYLGHLQADQRALDAAVEDEVEGVRRAVLNLDQNLCRMSDVFGALADQAGSRPPALQELLAENSRLLTKAETFAGKFTQIRQGSASAAGHLAANRIKAILYLTIGKLENNRAEFEENVAGISRRHAEQRVGRITALRHSVDLMEARKPTKALEKLEAEGTRLSANIQAVQAGLSSLQELITAKETQITRHDTAADEARRKLDELDEEALGLTEYLAAYADLSNAARAAEAEAAALRNGTLRGGTPVLQEGEGFLNGVYEGGTPQLGVRDLTFGRLLLEEQVAARRATKADLDKQREILEARLAALESEETETRDKIRTLTAEIDALLAEAREHAATAEAARQEALAALKRAGGDVGQAITAAKRRTADARQASSKLEGAVDERLAFIMKDGDTEGALHSLSAEIAYNTALTRLNRLNALQASFDALRYLAEMMGREPPAPATEELDVLRAQAEGDLAAAINSFGEARNKIGSTSVRASDGTTASGANSLWQIDVGEAAVHLLQANLAADVPEREAAREKAYELLTQAAQGREQSPLLTPAINTIQYLQRAAAP